MLRILSFLAVAFVLTQAAPASAAECRIGERVTLSVLIDGNLAKTDDGWFYAGVVARAIR